MSLFRSSSRLLPVPAVRARQFSSSRPAFGCSCAACTGGIPTLHSSYDIGNAFNAIRSGGRSKVTQRGYATPLEGAGPQGDYAFEVAASNLRFGEGVTKEVGMDFANQSARKVGVFTDKTIAKLLPMKMALESLEENGIKYEVFDRTRVEPNEESWQDAIKFAKQHDFSHFLAVGGGSVIDTCKVANLFTVYPDADLYDFINAPIGKGLPIEKTLRPLIAVPTTAGTGSETTGTAIADLPHLSAKTGIANRAMRPLLGIVDPLNTDSCPREVHISSGLDVLFHALESWTAIPYFERTPRPKNPLLRPAYQGRNPISDVFSEWALRQTVQYLPRVAKDSGDTQAKTQMLLASTFAGIGFGISYPVSGLNKKKGNYKHSGYEVDHPIVPHGISVALTGPSVFQFTAPSDPDRHRRAAEIFESLAVGSQKDHIDTSQVSDADIGPLLHDRIARFLVGLDVPRGLTALGYKNGDVEDLVKGTLPQRRVLDLAPGFSGNDGKEELTRIIEKASRLLPPAQVNTTGATLIEPVTRKSFGTFGASRTFTLSTNCFEVVMTIDPPANSTRPPKVPPKSLQRAFWTHIEKMEKDGQSTFFGHTRPAYDGRSACFTSSPLPGGEVTTIAIVPAPDRPTMRFTVVIKNPVKIELRQSSATSARTSRTKEAASKLNRPEVRKEALALAGGIELWRGFFQSVRTCRMGLQLNLDPTSTVFIKQGGLVDFSVEYLKSLTGTRNGRHQLLDVRYLNDRDLIRLNRAIKKLQVVVRREPKGAVGMHFDASGRPTNVQDYVRDQCGIRLNFPDLPVVEVKSGSFYPVEMVDIVEGNKWARKLTSEQQGSASQFQILKHILDAVSTEHLTSFGVSLAPNQKQINRRVLTPPSIEYADPNPIPNMPPIKTVDPREGAWQMRARGPQNEQKFMEGAPLSSYAVVVEDRRDVDGVTNFLMALLRNASNLGVGIDSSILGPIPPFLVYVKQPRDTVADAVHAAISRARQIIGRCSNSEISPDYAPLKLRCTELGVGSQAMQPKLLRKDRDVQTQVNMSMKTKARKQETIKNMREMAFFLIKRRVLALGKAPPTSIIFYRDGVSELEFEEVILNEVSELRKACEDVKKDPEAKSTAGEAAIAAWSPKVRLFFLSFSLCTHADPSHRSPMLPPLSQITFIAVLKRHHIRGFRDQGGRVDNIEPGTVFDDGVTDARSFDWYGAAHKVHPRALGGILGTTRPSRYVVLADDSDLSPDDLQSLSHSLCHSYQRCNRAVSVPAPTYYADLVCDAKAVIARTERGRNAFRARRGGPPPCMWWL
ncbi:hypothetical protein JCM8547_004093 [Rhodosporidiobolus lusitaniae]